MKKTLVSLVGCYKHGQLLRSEGETTQLPDFGENLVTHPLLGLLFGMNRDGHELGKYSVCGLWYAWFMNHELS